MTPPGRRKWTPQQLAEKRKWNKRKIGTIWFLKIRMLDGLDITSEDLAEELDISHKYAAMILLRYRRRGLLKVTRETKPLGHPGRRPVVYTGTQKLIDLANIIASRGR